MAEIPTPKGATAATKSRPLGITILAILMILGGILSLAGLAGSYSMFDLAWSAIAGVIGLILGISMWQLQPWARKFALLWYIISLFVSILLMYFIVYPIIEALVGPLLAGSVLMIALLPALIIDLIIIIYLNSGGVKAAFESVGGW